MHAFSCLLWQYIWQLARNTAAADAKATADANTLAGQLTEVDSQALSNNDATRVRKAHPDPEASVTKRTKHAPPTEAPAVLLLALAAGATVSEAQKCDMPLCHAVVNTQKRGHWYCAQHAPEPEEILPQEMPLQKVPPSANETSSNKGALKPTTGNEDGVKGRYVIDSQGKRRYIAAKCEHGRRRTTCKECGGGSTCEHKKERTRCKECRGGSLCEHDKQRSQCRECGGVSLCQHLRIRSVCKECGGKGICEHGRRRSQCRFCGGTSICQHKRERNKCKECGGHAFCEHGRIRRQCKDCASAYIGRTVEKKLGEHSVCQGTVVTFKALKFTIDYADGTTAALTTAALMKVLAPLPVVVTALPVEVAVSLANTEETATTGAQTAL